MKKSIFFLILLSCPTFAAVDKKMCNMSNESIIKRIVPKLEPNYFFKASPDGRYIYYIGENKNFRLDTHTGEELLLPGEADPVPSQDGKFLTSINWRNPSLPRWSLNLMQMKNWDIIRDRRGDFDKRTGRIDSNTSRTYQSVGTLDNGNYRVLSLDDSQAVGRLLIRDYKLNGSDILGVQSEDFKIPAEGYKLPMISRDGRELSLLDVNTNQTVIFSIAEDGSGIREIDRLDYPSGKADFNFDSSKIAFHVTETVNQNRARRISAEIALPPKFNDEAEVRNVFVYDRNNKSITPVTQNKIGNSYFPVFIENDTIIYLDQRPGQKLSFVYSKIPDVPPRSIDIARSCFKGEVFDDSFSKLAELWKGICTDWDGGDNSALKVMMLNIPYDFCIQIAKSSRGKDKAELIKVCDALAESEIKKPSIATLTNPVEKMLQVKCAICHQDNLPFKDKAKLKDYKNKILKRVKSKDEKYRMPLGGSLSQSEIKELEVYLKSL
ncbi:hypothetical protein [Halobacteriovorax sp. HLS]|uniref:hypothetical protein n=1 Tax=Halobacteriovorax sp. HLS TaxID=2234000 RepID=UPI000FD6EE2F|nr:hypothetical protein [Halobacteriovorax sp. HLS]